MKVDEANKENTFLIFRFSEKRWIEAFLQGHLSFSCAGAYIKQAINTGNCDQGDKFEAIFARVKRDDYRIKLMQDQLGNDLEIIEDGEYVLLRRESAKIVPIFCFFNYRICDLAEGEIKKIDEDNAKITMTFDDRMFNGFSNTDVKDENQKLTVVTVYVQKFLERITPIIHSGFGNDNQMQMGNVDYSLREEETFFIEPTASYHELMHKRGIYSYQHEGRIIIPGYRFHDVDDRYDLVVDEYEEHADYEVTDNIPFRLQFIAKLAK